MNRMMKTCERSLLNQSIHGFHIVKKLGEGSYASVWLGQHPITNCLVAIKSISKERINDAIKITRFQRELSLMKSLDHPLIASLFFYDQDDHYHYLGIEYASKGDLQNYVNSHGKIIEPIARKYFVQLISVLEYLHKEKRIINRDLKAENILLDDNLNIRVVDFGLSNSFQGDNPKFSTMCGSPAYVPPEMIKGQQYTTSADIWSAGVFLYAIVTSRLPFDDVNQQIMLKKIKCAQPNYPSYLSSSLIDLLGRLLTKSPTDRITLDQIKEHPWFSASEYTCLTNYLHNCLSSNQNLNTHRLYFNGVMKDEIDNEILQELEQLGIDVSNLKHKVFARSDDEVVVLYQIKAKSKITNELRNVAKSCPKVASTPEPTNIRFTFDSSKLIAPGKSILKYDQDKIPTIQLNRPNIHNFARQRCVPVIPLSAVAIRGNRSVKSNSIQPK